MMLLYGRVEVRVRRSGLAACRTVVAQDAAGVLLIIASEGAVTFGNSSQWLRDSDLRLV